MQTKEKYKLLRKILRALGLPAGAVDDLVQRVADLLTDEKKTPHEGFPYRLRDDFLSPAELSFYHILEQAAGDWALVLTKVSLGDLFYAKVKDYSAFRAYTNKIDRKHVDYLLCDPKTVRPLLGVELDDGSHKRRDRQQRDSFVDQVFDAAELPLVRVPVRRTYNVAEVRRMLQQHASTARESGASQAEAWRTPEEPEVGPACPKCGGEMVLRTARSGTHKGGQFWGCAAYPQCRGIVAAI
jgi:predicted RNA-binding Zn-ribbon protein involved in translation (DUF1610 family)